MISSLFSNPSKDKATSPYLLWLIGLLLGQRSVALCEPFCVTAISVFSLLADKLIFNKGFLKPVIYFRGPLELKTERLL